MQVKPVHASYTVATRACLVVDPGALHLPCRRQAGAFHWCSRQVGNGLREVRQAGGVEKHLYVTRHRRSLLPMWLAQALHATHCAAQQLAKASSPPQAVAQITVHAPASPTRLSMAQPLCYLTA